ASRVYEELDRAAFWGPALGADKARIKAGIAALEGRSQEALDGFRSALAAFHALELDFDEAATAVDAAVLLPPAERDEPDIKVAIEGAGATLRRLGGTPFVAQLERGLAAAPQPGPRSLTGSRSS
ncbi:MAG TPA: hypothetical protein VHR16_01625, partial [Candidatus Limnocylindrales bacterium]|nr:hypothetical protein [Candidatus Limnocylindrales bacterium]